MKDGVPTPPAKGLPDVSGLRSLTDEVIDALRTARREIHEQLQEREGRIKACEDELSRRQEEFDTSIESEKTAVSQREDELREEQQHLQAERESLTAATHTLEERERAAAALEERIRQTEAQLQDVAAKQHAREYELEERVAQIDTHGHESESQAAEAASARETVAMLQNQLERELAEVAAQREELMRRLDVTPMPAAGEPTQPLPDEAPAPAEESSERKKAGMFRKLRRDAKRKALGV